MNPPLVWLLVLVATAGAVAGSFIATAALRIASGEVFLKGRSRCDGCGSALSFVATVPLFSYAVRGGAARCCRARIDPLHPIGEALAALIGIAALIVAFASLRPAVSFGLVLALGLILLALALIDLKTLRLPDPLVAAVAFIGVLATLLLQPERWAEVAIAALVSLLLLEGLRRGFERLRGYGGLGGGDVKLVAALALWLGALIPLVLALASLTGLVQAVALRRRKIAFGPHIAAAGFAVALAAPWLRQAL